MMLTTMKAMIAGAGIAVTFAFAVPAVAQPVPLEFKGIRLGHPIPASAKADHLTCGPAPHTPGLVCKTLAAWHIGGDIPVSVTVGTDKQERVDTILVTFPSRAFDRLTTALTVKYGKPTNQSAEDRFWQFGAAGKIAIAVSYRGLPPGEGGLVFSTPATTAAAKAIRERRALKDLE